MQNDHQKIPFYVLDSGVELSVPFSDAGAAAKAFKTLRHLSLIDLNYENEKPLTPIAIRKQQLAEFLALLEV